MWFFASDFHLGLYQKNNHEQENELINFLTYCVKSKATKIFLVGDLFDFWFEYKEVVPKGYFRLFTLFYEIVNDHKIELYLFKGNHDMWMFSYLEKECGVKIITNELEIKSQKHTFFIHHGDGLGPGDYGYKILKKIFRSKLNQWLFARLHPNFALGLGKFLSKSSRLAKKNEQDLNVYMGDDKEFLTQYVLTHPKLKDIDFFIFGHRHLDLEIKINEKSAYINLGEWIYKKTYVQYNGEKLELKKWE